MSEPTETRPPLTVSYLVSESVNYPFRNWRFMLAKPVLWTISYILYAIAITIAPMIGLFGLSFALGMSNSEAGEIAGAATSIFGAAFLVLTFFVFIFLVLFLYGKLYILIFSHMVGRLDRVRFFAIEKPEPRLWLALVKLYLLMLAIYIVGGLCALAIIAGGGEGVPMSNIVIVGFLVGLPLVVGVLILFVRITTFLPRAFFGEGTSIGLSFSDTSGHTLTLFLAAVLLTLVSFGITFATLLAHLPFEFFFALPTQSTDDATDIASFDPMSILVSLGVIVSLGIQLIASVFTIAIFARRDMLVYEALVGTYGEDDNQDAVPRTIETAESLSYQ